MEFRDYLKEDVLKVLKTLYLPSNLPKIGEFLVRFP